MSNEENNRKIMEGLSKGRQCYIIRKRLGLTQKEFAVLIGVTVNADSDWENERYEPSDSHWKIIKALPNLQRDPKEELQMAFLSIIPLCPECQKVVENFIRNFYKTLNQKLECSEKEKNNE